MSVKTRKGIANKADRFVRHQRFDVSPDSSGQERTRVFVVSQSIELREGAAPIRRVLIFDDHPATLRLLKDLACAQQRNKLALVKFSALIFLLVLAMFWPVF